MKIFTHYVVTRFNIKSEGWVNDKNGKTVNDFDWLINRYILFEAFCLPSILSQKNKEFKWLVFFDKETPPEFVHKNKLIKTKCSHFVPFYVDGFSDFESTLREFVYKDSKTEYILTSRLDNDDCLHENAIEAIQAVFEKKDLTIIELSKGLTMLVGKQTKLAKREDVYSGPFITLIEKKYKQKLVKTVYDCEHRLWCDLVDFISVESNAYWLQIIHEANISNKLHDDLTFNKSLLRGFKFNYNVQFKFSYILFVICKNIGLFKLKSIFKNSNEK